MSSAKDFSPGRPGSRGVEGRGTQAGATQAHERCSQEYLAPDCGRPAWRLVSSRQSSLLEQLCETVAAQRVVLTRLQATPMDMELVKTVTALGNLTIALSTKLRLTVQADVVRQSRKIDQREPKAHMLLGGWERPA